MQGKMQENNSRNASTLLQLKLELLHKKDQEEDLQEALSEQERNAVLSTTLDGHQEYRRNVEETLRYATQPGVDAPISDSNLSNTLWEYLKQDVLPVCRIDTKLESASSTNLEGIYSVQVSARKLKCHLAIINGHTFRELMVDLAVHWSIHPRLLGYLAIADSSNSIFSANMSVAATLASYAPCDRELKLVAKLVPELSAVKEFHPANIKFNLQERRVMKKLVENRHNVLVENFKRYLGIELDDEHSSLDTINTNVASYESRFRKLELDLDEEHRSAIAALQSKSLDTHKKHHSPHSRLHSLQSRFVNPQKTNVEHNRSSRTTRAFQIFLTTIIRLPIIVTLLISLLHFQDLPQVSRQRLAIETNILNVHVSNSGVLVPSFNDITSRVEFINWLKLNFAERMFETCLLKSDPTTFETEKCDSTSRHVVGFVNELMGGVRVRQLRVQTNECKLAQEFDSSVCFPSYIHSIRDQETLFENCNQEYCKYSEFTSPNTPRKSDDWLNVAVLSHWSHGSIKATYAQGGYFAHIQSKDEMVKFVNTIESVSWLDRQTRAVVVEANLYNAGTGRVTLIKLLVEFTPDGAVNPIPLITVTNPIATVVATSSRYQEWAQTLYFGAGLWMILVVVLIPMMRTVRSFQLELRSAITRSTENNVQQRSPRRRKLRKAMAPPRRLNQSLRQSDAREHQNMLFEYVSFCIPILRRRMQSISINKLSGWKVLDIAVVILLIPMAATKLLLNSSSDPVWIGINSPKYTELWNVGLSHVGMRHLSGWLCCISSLRLCEIWCSNRNGERIMQTISCANSRLISYGVLLALPISLGIATILFVNLGVDDKSYVSFSASMVSLDQLLHVSGPSVASFPLGVVGWHSSMVFLLIIIAVIAMLFWPMPVAILIDAYDLVCQEEPTTSFETSTELGEMISSKLILTWSSMVKVYK